jgi:hypothetical protein
LQRGPQRYYHRTARQWLTYEEERKAPCSNGGLNEYLVLNPAYSLYVNEVLCVLTYLASGSGMPICLNFAIKNIFHVMRRCINLSLKYLKEALSNNPIRSGVDFDLLEVSSFSVDRVPLGPDSVESR